MKLSTWCLWPATFGLAAVLQPAVLDSLAGAGPSNQMQDEERFNYPKRRWIGFWPWEKDITKYKPYKMNRPGVPQWSGGGRWLSDSEFCSLARTMQFIARSLVCDTWNMVPEKSPSNSTELLRGPCQRQTSVEETARMMMALELLIRVVKRQLRYTPGLSDEMRCAVCYIEYCRQVTRWLTAMNEQSHRFRWPPADRKVIAERINALRIEQVALARVLHESKKKAFIFGKLPEFDKTGWTEKIQRLYDKKPGTSLRQWAKEEDPGYPYRDHGHFYFTRARWAKQDSAWHVNNLKPVTIEATDTSAPHWNAATALPANITSQFSVKPKPSFSSDSYGALTAEDQKFGAASEDEPEQAADDYECGFYKEDEPVDTTADYECETTVRDE